MELSCHPVGIDVSKDTLDIALLSNGQTFKRRQANDLAAFADLLQWIQTQTTEPVHVCLEATGTYHDALLAFLLAAGLRVSVLPSNRLKAFRESEGIRSKTDRLDALLLARYCSQKNPAPFVPLPKAQAQLQELLTRLAQLQEMAQQERNRLGNARLDDESRTQLGEHIQLLENWEKQLLERIRTFLTQEEDLHTAQQLLQTIPGIGERSSWHLLALLGSDAHRFSSPRQVVLFVGLDVARRDSGKRKAGQISKRGPARIRGCLGMAALVSKRWDPHMRQWATELSARNKKHRQVRVAIMRKLVHLAYGVLTSQKPYDPSQAWPTHASELAPQNQAA